VGFWKKFKFWKKRGESSWDKLVAADLQYIEKLNGINAEMDARITELQETLKEINDRTKLAQDTLRCQIKELGRQCETGIMMCAGCITEEMKFALYKMDDAREVTLL
jgi:hypothetical protein